MYKKLVIICVISMIVLSQSVINIQTGTTGSYLAVSQKQFTQLLETQEFNNVLNLATTYWQQTYSEGLGKILDLQKQIVAGYNYKIIFKAEPNKPYSQAVVVIFVQPWSNIMEVTNAWKQPKQGRNLKSN